MSSMLQVTHRTPTRKLNSTEALSAGRLRRDNVTLTVDLLIPKLYQFVCAPRCTTEKVWQRTINRYWRYHGII